MMTTRKPRTTIQNHENGITQTGETYEQKRCYMKGRRKKEQQQLIQRTSHWQVEVDCNQKRKTHKYPNEIQQEQEKQSQNNYS